MDEKKYKTHEDWIHVALEAATQALPHDVPVGALLVSEGRLIAQGFNRREVDNNPVAHAEILVLQAAASYLKRWRLNNTVLYVTLEPCPMCASAIQQARVGQVVFGAFDPIMGACGSQYGLLLDSPELPVRGGVLEDACGSMLRHFFEQARNKHAKP
jgi:tRNA(adenine34) deaminase